ncbi:MAG: hypothetical protein QOJ46_534, partial [bacterium]
LVERLVEVIPDDIDVLWQTGATDVSGLPIDAHHSLPDATLRDAMADADLVIAHAGIGSTIAALEAGRPPLLAPRDPAHGEHVDDHQQQIAENLRELNIATILDPEDITTEAILDMASVNATRNEAPPRFALGEAPVATEPESAPVAGALAV